MSERADEIIAKFIEDVLTSSKAQCPLVIGLNGPQGSGKTTATTEAVKLLGQEKNLRGITISIDDFYLTRAEQVALASARAQNPYLQQRGYPGTHDIRLGVTTLAKLKAINTVKQPVALPHYDKSLEGGEGDRLPEVSWPTVAAPLDFVILEGWCVGFIPVDVSRIIDPNLREINHMLSLYAEWHAFLDAFIQFKAQDIRDTVRWRIEAEEKMRAQGKAGMSDERIKAYIERFLPAYELYLPGLEVNPPVASPRLVLHIAGDRKIASYSHDGV